MKPNSVIVTMPTRGLIFTEVQDALDRELAANHLMPLIIRTHDLPLPVSRNFLVESALKFPDWEYMLMIDDDTVIPKGGLKSLLALNADVAVMNYPMHQKVNGQGVGTIVHDKDKSIAYAGLGLVLVKRKVFEAIGSNWFVLTEYRINRSKSGEIGFYTGQPDGRLVANSAGEDTYFYLQCRKHKFTIKETKQTAAHLRFDQVITTTHTNRYSRQHLITKVDKIERELL